MKKSVIIGSIVVSLFLVILMGITIKASMNGENGQVVVQMNFTRAISVADQVAQPEEASYEIEIEDAGDYVFYGKWEANAEGLITGCKILDETGKEVFMSTAESCMMSSAPLYLAEGEYTLALSYITSMEQWAEFVGEGFCSEEDYPFAEEGQFTIPYEFRLEKHFNSMGIMMVLAMMLGLVLAVIIKSVITKGDDVKSNYDERQELVRGRGYKYGFFTVIVANLLYYMMQQAGIGFSMSGDIAMVVNMLIGICVCACYCIWNEGYFALNEKIGTFIVIVLIGGGINLIMGIHGFISGAAMQNGKYTFYIINLLAGIMILIICGVMLLKKICRDREDD